MFRLSGPIFCLVLCYFIVQSGWYEPAQLVVRGNLLTDRAILEVQWDSGEGFNSYERKRFDLVRQTVDDRRKHQLVVRRVKSENQASLSKDVFVKRISADGRELDLAEIARSSGYELHEQSLRLSGLKEELTLEAEARESIVVEMLTNNISGKVSVGVDGVFRDRDLYAANEKSTSFAFEHWLVGALGDFVVRSAMPRYPLRTLQIRNADIRGQLAVSSIQLETGKETLTLSGGQDPLTTTQLPGQSWAQKRYFGPSQFAYDVLFAGLTTWLIVALVNLYRAGGGLSGIFSGPRRVFWFFFLGCLAVYSIWLTAFWPGVASVDSLKIWRAAILPGVYLDDHPLLNVILYKYLAHLWNNMAVVPLFQVVLMSLLIASIFYFLFCRGVALRLLVPFYLLLLFSLPIGLYNTVLWKDIPFAITTVFWGYLLVTFHLKRIEGTLKYSRQQIAALLMLLGAVALIRHNGVVYLVIIPLYFVVLRLIPLRVVAFSVLTIAGIAAMSAFILMKGGLISGGGYVLSQGTGFLQNFLSKSFSDILASAWKNYWQIFNVNQTVSAWDLFHLYLGDRTAYQFLHATGWNDVFHYLPPGQSLVPALHGLAMRLYKMSYQTPFVYITWNGVHFLGLYLLAIALFRKFPSAAIFGSFILVQVFTLLVFVDVMNWRYYYFAFLGGYLLIPFMLLDLQRGNDQKKGMMLHEV